MMGPFAGKVAIVTGAGRGMGRTIVEALCAEGAKVMIGARTVSHGEIAVSELRKKRAVVGMCKTDVTIRDDIVNLVRETVKEYAALDIVVHCAAEVPIGDVLEVTDEAIERGLASSVKAAFWLTREATPYLSLSKNGGRMVFISSICGPKTALTGLVAYGVAKGGLDSFIRGAALDLARHKITVNGINPGTISTDRMRSSLSDAQVKDMASVIPMGRVGQPEEIARAVLFFSSPHAGYITGQTITIDGGWTLSVPGADRRFYQSDKP